MNPEATIVVILLGLAAFVGIGLLATNLLERRRTNAIVEHGTSLGFKQEMVLPGELDGFSGATEIMNIGRRRQATSILRREVPPLDVVLFDYRYTVGSGKHSHTSHQTLAVFRSSRLKNPGFVIKPEGFFNRVGAMLGVQDIDFEDSPEFSRKYVLQGANEELIRVFLTPERRDLIASFDRLCLEAHIGCLYFWFDRKRTPPSELQAFFEKAFTVYSAFAEPDHDVA
jgi:hypothetical protein